jgi:aspartyl protease family protein
MKSFASGLLLAALLPLAAAQTVTFNGRMGDKALLVIDGQPHVLTAGQAMQGVKVVSVGADEARVEVGGRSLSLRQGAPVSVGGGASGGTGAGTEIVLTAGPGGHFRTAGSINRSAVDFMVDTGATYVALSAATADRIGLDWHHGRPLRMGTANGVTTAYEALLTSVRIGDVEVHDVPAVVHETSMDYILLGNSFLSRFDMQRTGSTMRLSRKY